MTKGIRIGEQTVVYDREATLQLYADVVTAAGCDECSCVYCKNFAAQRDRVYPHEFLTLLSELGVDPLKELEAFDYDFEQGSSKSLYGGWFVFCGELREGASWRPQHDVGSFTYWFATSFPTGGLPSNVRLCAIEFCTEIPWVVSEQPDTNC